MIDPKEIKKVFGEKFVYDDNGQMVFGEHSSLGLQLAISIRGWGRIEKVFGSNNGMQFHDDFGRWVVDAMNEKLNRCLTTDVPDTTCG